MKHIVGYIALILLALLQLFGLTFLTWGVLDTWFYTLIHGEQTLVAIFATLFAVGLGFLLTELTIASGRIIIRKYL
jgi:hypothetical protein